MPGMQSRTPTPVAVALALAVSLSGSWSTPLRAQSRKPPGSPAPASGAPAPTGTAPTAGDAGPEGTAATTERRPFCRFVDREDGGALEVLIATYRKGKATVTLHASLHVADAEHYAELQRRFERFDALLYELVGEADLRPHPGMEFEDDALSMLQGGMGRGLGLADQIACLDYRRSNFVHADLTPDELDAAYEAAGSSLLGEFVASGLADLGRDAPREPVKVDVVGAMREGRGTHVIRILFARLMCEPDAQGEPSVVIEGRNERCLEVLQRELQAGKRTLGVYYGAAHMEHLERRLVRDLGFEKTGEEWIVAWDCRANRFPVAEKGLQQKRYRARRDLLALEEAVAQWLADRPGATPTWDALRAARADAKLPGRADGVDPWGRAYVLRRAGGDWEVRCLGSDGVIDTEDDVTAR